MFIKVVLEAGGFLSLRSAWSCEFQDSQSYTEKPCLEKPKKKKKRKRKKKVVLVMVSLLSNKTQTETDNVRI